MENEQQSRARELIEQFLVRVEKEPPAMLDNMGLFGGGIELDSLEAAELSAILEDTFGADPFTTGDKMPETIGDVLAFYAMPSGV